VQVVGGRRKFQAASSPRPVRLVDLRRTCPATSSARHGRRLRNIISECTLRTEVPRVRFIHTRLTLEDASPITLTGIPTGFLPQGCPKIASPSPSRSSRPRPRLLRDASAHGVTRARGPPSWFLPTSAAYAQTVLQVCCALQATMRFAAFPPPPCHRVGGRYRASPSAPHPPEPSPSRSRTRVTASRCPLAVRVATRRPRGLAPHERPLPHDAVADAALPAALLGFPSWSHQPATPRATPRKGPSRSRAALPSTSDRSRSPPFTRRFARLGSPRPDPRYPTSSGARAGRHLAGASSSGRSPTSESCALRRQLFVPPSRTPA